MALRLFTIGAVGAAASSEASPMETVFGAFVAKHGKIYASVEERLARLATFVENYRFIEEHNAGKHRYTLEVNEFADQSSEEFQAQRLGLSRATSAWAGVPHLGTHLYSGDALKAEVDWVAGGAVTPVKNQQSCGSCWAFSSTGALEGAWQLEAGELTPLSEQQLIDCNTRGNNGCHGGTMDVAFQFLQGSELCSEASYPYQHKQGHCQHPCSDGLPKGAVTGYKTVTPRDTQALMEALGQQPVSVGIAASNHGFQFYKSGVLVAECGDSLDHGVLAVGYGSLDGMDYWKIKNSWGANWGENGFIRIARGPAEFDNQCGIKDMPSYPVVMKRAQQPTTAQPSASTEPDGVPTCQDDEVVGEIGGGFTVCAPRCDASGGCTTLEKRSPFTKPACMLQTDDGQQLCALRCLFDFQCEGSGARCVPIGERRWSKICAVERADISAQRLRPAAESDILV